MRIRSNIAWSDARRLADQWNFEAEADESALRYRVTFDRCDGWCVDRYRVPSHRLAALGRA